ncbi:hypothetical protein NP7_09285 (plasmid) [Moraxella osloensis]|uniref:Uncharacterized protein n=1 Tax=Faucicola osloensis TaxID=34062 RepID=A0A2D2LX00_FAUOS|nr:hypothetical protein NP7_09285 [Moraxella osloensis]
MYTFQIYLLFSYTYKHKRIDHEKYLYTFAQSGMLPDKNCLIYCAGTLNTENNLFKFEHDFGSI